MPFDPLETDERLTSPAPQEQDFDRQLLGGCAMFVVTSFLSYALSVWPFFAIPDSHLLRSFLLSCLAGFVPTLIFGAVASRKAGLPGLCGFLGGVMATGIFLYLRVTQLMLGNVDRHIPKPEFPSSWAWLVPFAFLLASGLVGLVLLPKGQLFDEPEAISRR